MRHIIFVFIASVLFPVLALAQAEGYPGREIYPTVKVYETEQLKNNFDQVVIVDVRSKYEFDTLHINSAINIPLNDRGFSKRVEALQAGPKPIVFYCNGHSCYKSYKACVAALDAGINNIFAYDSGVFDWARAYPDKATLLGKTPIDTARLISGAKLKENLLDPKQFSSRINDNAVILDIRDPKQRGLVELYPYRQENIAMDDTQKLNSFLKKIKSSGKTLLVYDEAGKQVRWFQYYLVENGIKNYYFMNGGVKQFFKDLKS